MYSDSQALADNLSQYFKVSIITSLNQVKRTGWYSGGAITEVTPYVAGGWNVINATVQTDGAARISVFNNRSYILEVFRDADGAYTFVPIATKSDIAALFTATVSGGIYNDACYVPDGDTIAERTRLFRVLAGTTKNMPSGCSYGVRTIKKYENSRWIVEIEELSPVPGRIWSNVYIDGSYQGWKSITPV